MEAPRINHQARLKLEEKIAAIEARIAEIQRISADDERLPTGHPEDELNGLNVALDKAKVELARMSGSSE